MKTLTAKELLSQNPDLFETIDEAFRLALPCIEPHVAMTLEKAEPGDTAIHSTFLRIVDDNTKETLFIEMHSYFTKLPNFGLLKVFTSNILSRLGKIILYDTFQDYETARKKMIADSEREQGGKGFPTFKNFGGKFIGIINEN